MLNGLPWQTLKDVVTLLVSSGAAGAAMLYLWRRLPGMLSSESQSRAQVEIAKMSHHDKLIQRLLNRVQYLEEQERERSRQESERQKENRLLREENRKLSGLLEEVRVKYEVLTREHDALQAEYQEVKKRLDRLEKIESKRDG